MQPPHRKYLKRRRLDPDELSDLWGFKGVGVSHEYQWRIVIPTTLEGEVVTWTTRTIDDTVEPRYKSAPADRERVSVRDVLFGEDFCRHAIAVAEGHLDAVTVGPGMVATGGTGYSDAHLLRIAKYPVRIVSFDNTPDGHKRADKLVRELSVFEGETVKATCSGKDWNSSSDSDVREIRRMLR